MGDSLSTADDLVDALHGAADAGEVSRIRARVADDEPVIGVRMGTLFDIAKRATDVPRTELEALFAHPAYEPRLAAFCILDFRARRRLDDEGRADLAGLYLDHHDAVSTWDMVDRAAPRVLGWPVLVGATAFSVLQDLTRSRDPLRRRSAITAPLWFIKKGSDADVRRGLEIADRLAEDRHPRVASAVTIYRKHASGKRRVVVMRCKPVGVSLGLGGPALGAQPLARLAGRSYESLGFARMGKRQVGELFEVILWERGI
ncbi:DNA alkylation repair protein [Georgenia sp. Z1491]|uniref:DNA alkylation repair protein n=1 Tax=Georgenia sp. Z1491 TaxID=3416707 RepID=UPI003CF8A06E